MMIGGRGTKIEEGMRKQSEMIWRHKQSLWCNLLEASDGQENFLHRSAVFSDHLLVANLAVKPCTRYNFSLFKPGEGPMQLKYSSIDKTKVLYRCDRQLESQSLKLFVLQHVSEM